MVGPNVFYKELNELFALANPGIPQTAIQEESGLFKGCFVKLVNMRINLPVPGMFAKWIWMIIGFICFLEMKKESSPSMNLASTATTIEKTGVAPKPTATKKPAARQSKANAAPVKATATPPSGSLAITRSPSIGSTQKRQKPDDMSASGGAMSASPAMAMNLTFVPQTGTAKENPPKNRSESGADKNSKSPLLFTAAGIASASNSGPATPQQLQQLHLKQQQMQYQQMLAQQQHQQQQQKQQMAMFQANAQMDYMTPEMSMAQEISSDVLMDPSSISPGVQSPPELMSHPGLNSQQAAGNALSPDRTLVLQQLQRERLKQQQQQLQQVQQQQQRQGSSQLAQQSNNNSAQAFGQIVQQTFQNPSQSPQMQAWKAASASPAAPSQAAPAPSQTSTTTPVWSGDLVWQQNSQLGSPEQQAVALTALLVNSSKNARILTPADLFVLRIFPTMMTLTFL